jgi:hypothetical protein
MGHNFGSVQNFGSQFKLTILYKAKTQNAKQSDKNGIDILEHPHRPSYHPLLRSGSVFHDFVTEEEEETTASEEEEQD